MVKNLAYQSTPLHLIRKMTKSPPTTFREYCQELVARTKDIEEETALKLAVSFHKSSDRYNRMLHEVDFQVDDYVCARNSITRVGECQK